MDQSLTSPKTTPFSINDILTKNNTTILRRNSSGHLSPIDKKFVHERDCEQMQEPSDDSPQLQLKKSMHFLKYSPQRYENDCNIDQPFNLDHRSSPNYLCNNNNNKIHNATEVRNERNVEKKLKPLRFYNFPLMLERPLDMRLCADEEDSGEKLI